MSELACPQCKNPDVRRFALIHKQGSSATSSATTGIGIGGGGLGIGAASTKGVQVSALASETAPPQQKALGWPVFIAIVAAIGLFGSFGEDAGGAGGLWFFTLAVSGTIAYQRVKFNREVHPKLKSTWESSFMCMRCGAAFQSLV